MYTLSLHITRTTAVLHLKIMYVYSQGPCITLFLRIASDTITIVGKVCVYWLLLLYYLCGYCVFNYTQQFLRIKQIFIRYL